MEENQTPQYQPNIPHYKRNYRLEKYCNANHVHQIPTNRKYKREETHMLQITRYLNYAPT